MATTTGLGRLKFVPVLLLAILASGCVTSKFSTTEKLQRKEGPLRIVLMPIDVELGLLNAGGVVEPNAEWTAKAKNFILEDVRTKLAAQQAELVLADDDLADLPTEDTRLQLVKLHEAVGRSILLHQYRDAGGLMPLPTKDNNFDWSLGAEIGALRQHYNADYAMFVFVRDSYTSAGRVAVIIALALLRVPVHGGSQAGFASLVDLNSGDLVWFNRLARAEGDLRKAEGAQETVDVLLTGFPK
ncbi:MAG: hypothetical protein H6907_10390 [Hyphomicrobiales bacterium]|nr:hypothetical protein [Hyphomicrobiales bacterium]MCP5372128.1 hypothetical protein [Hyphomicrobiales bacterium]